MKKSRRDHKSAISPISSRSLETIRGGGDTRSGTRGGDDDPGTIVIIDRDGP